VILGECKTTQASLALSACWPSMIFLEWLLSPCLVIVTAANAMSVYDLGGKSIARE